jgi:hypothetical protein
MAVNRYDKYGFLQKIEAEVQDQVLLDLQQLEEDQFANSWSELIADHKTNVQKVSSTIT